jgi:hypothetical protein
LLARSSPGRTVGQVRTPSRNSADASTGKGRRRLRRLVVGVALIAVLMPASLVVADSYAEGKVVTNNDPDVRGPEKAAEYYRSMQTDPVPLPPAEGTDAVEIDHVPQSQDRGAWEREIRARETSRELMHGRGPSVRKPVEYTYRPDHTKILLVGDSYVYGYSHEVKENVFDRQLEQMLQSVSNGAYEVVTLATDQSSFLRQSDWVSPEKLRAIDPDVVILTHTIGRLQPTFMEEKYCKQFNTCVADGARRPMEDATGHSLDRANDKWKIMMCLRADTSPVSTLFRRVLYPYVPNLAEILAKRYCTMERILKGVDLPTERTGYQGDYENHPHIGDLDEALSRVRAAVESLDKPVGTYMLNLPWDPTQLSYPMSVDGRSTDPGLAPVFARFEKYGFEEIPRPIADEKMISHRLWDANNVQGDSKGTSRNRCVYDCEVSDEQWQANLKMYNDGLLSHPMKYRQGNVMQYAIARDVASFIVERHPAPADTVTIPQPLLLEYTPAFLGIGANSNDYATIHHYKMNRELGYSTGFDWDGFWVASSCARMNAPHAVIALNPNNLKDGAVLRVGYHRGVREQLVLTFERRDADGNLVPARTVRLARGSSYTLQDTAGVSNVYVADTSVTCTDKEIVLEPFEMSFRAIRN